MATKRQFGQFGKRARAAVEAAGQGAAAARSSPRQALDELLTQSIAVLMERKLVEVSRVAQDGLRVRASAKSGSMP